MESKILPIAGDASFRKFYRFILNNNSKIIVSAKEEKYKNLVAYSAINKFLRKNKILTPKLLAHDYPKGIIVIEDFGSIVEFESIKNLLVCRSDLTYIYQTDFTFINGNDFENRN